MLKLSDVLVQKLEKKTSQRGELISEIYDIYSSQQQRNFRKRENWKRYIGWLKANRIDEKKLGRREAIKTWMKKGKGLHKFIKEYSIKEIAIFLAPFNSKNNNMDVLYYISSMARDMKNRNQNFGAYFINAIYFKK